MNWQNDFIYTYILVILQFFGEPFSFPSQLTSANEATFVQRAISLSSAHQTSSMTLAPAIIASSRKTQVPRELGANFRSLRRSRCSSVRASRWSTFSQRQTRRARRVAGRRALLATKIHKNLKTFPTGQEFTLFPLLQFTYKYAAVLQKIPTLFARSLYRLCVMQKRNAFT